ncbi:DUF2975 domain-containing protein [Streptococcus sp. HF-1907]|uniref:DUF2975 domain-containing protein n=1 Tax=Streptococcus sp. HF-1907 TaxID=2785793 RepID=UPI00189E1A5D|nr:DUF2975 domain-containing protein [Streptococcus sp. HF-1907]MBF7094398.1 DUF2975 domain-containing protein [Streptococcus sp. HF-1907]
MNKEMPYLKYVIVAVNIGIFLSISALLVTTSYNLLGLAGGLDQLNARLASKTPQGTSFNFNVEKMSLWLALADFIHNLVTACLLICVRLFLKNIMADEIFIEQNVRLARMAALMLVIGAVITSNGALSAELGSLKISIFDLTYLLSAVLVWTISKVLEKANAIAEENEFTI